MKNGRTKAAIISAAAALLLAGISTASFYGGWSTKIAREARREQTIEQHLGAAGKDLGRLSKVEEVLSDRGPKIDALSARVDNLDTNVRTLIEAQVQTNEKLDRLSDTLMQYLARQVRAGPAR